MVSRKLEKNPEEANISKEISKPLQENEPLAKKIDEGESGLSKSEPVIQTKGRFEIKSNVEKIDIKEKELEMPVSVNMAPIPAVSAKSASMNDGVTQEWINHSFYTLLVVRCLCDRYAIFRSLGTNVSI
jgi:hypothetical protein